MNILIYSRSLPFHRLGGMELVAWQVCEGLAKRGHRVHIVTTAIPRQADLAALKHSPPTLSIDVAKATPSGCYSRAWWSATRLGTEALLNRFSPDLVLSISAAAKTALPFFDRIPVVMQAHGTSWAEFKSKLRSGRFRDFLTSPGNAFAWPHDLRMYRHFDRIVAIGPFVSNELERPIYAPYVGDKLKTIPNGVDTLRFQPDLEQRLRLRRHMGLAQDSKIALWASRLQSQKGLDRALVGLAQAQAKDVHLFVVGDGPQRQELQQQAQALQLEQRVHFVGAVAHDKVATYFAAADIFVFTTKRDEGLPLNVLEAMSSSLPCVIASRLAKNLPGIEKLEGIFLVDESDENAVGMAMNQAFAKAPNPALRSFVERYYSQAHMLDCYENLFTELVSRPATS